VKDLEGLLSLVVVALFVGFVVWIFARKQGGPPIVVTPPAPPPGPVTPLLAIILEPFTMCGMNGFKALEDTLLNFSPNDRECQGASGRRKWGVWGVPVREDKRALASGCGINVKVHLDNEPVGFFEAVYANKDANGLGSVPLGDNFTTDLLLRWFPYRTEPKPPYPILPKGCNPPPVVVPTPSTRTQTGTMYVTVTDGKEIVEKQFPIVVNELPIC